MPVPKPTYVYGIWPVREGLETNLVSHLFIAHGASGPNINAVITSARQRAIPVAWVSRNKLESMVEGNHQGVVAQTRSLRYAELDHIWTLVAQHKQKGPALLFLDGIVDPQNFGSIVRSAAYFGVAAIIIPNRRAAPLSTAVLRASAGTAMHLPIAEVSNLGNAIEMARKKGLWIVGADMDGQDVKASDVPRPFALIMGSESEGLHESIKKKCDVVVSIKKFAKSVTLDSLNVGVACGIFLHQFS